MPTDRVRAAIAAAAARHDALTAEELAKIDMMVLLATHLLVCCPIESLDGGAHHKWHRELHPPINGVGCRCKGVPMKVFGPHYFLAKRTEAA